ncbi:HIRAN domain-containing protein [Paenibacillus campi]|uniref:HIRAN domain-containing protein n=1 Tax=Paenibacillus campi TaxID=3106031 RepID=UPI002AFF6A64|nr:HIRAN domain-containing protein [Paenibacillus sp. SGZ-1014]
MYPIIDISTWEHEDVSVSGSKEKRWYRNPCDHKLHLFKLPVSITSLTWKFTNEYSGEKISSLGDLSMDDVYQKLLVMWKSPTSKKNYAVGTLQIYDKKYIFYYNSVMYQEARSEGFEPFVGLSDPYTRYVSEKLFSSFERRIPNRERSVFKRFLKEHHITTSNPEWAYLTITQGMLATDSISFVAPIIFIQNKNIVLLTTAVAGWSNMDVDAIDFELEDRVSLLWDKQNDYDAQAIKLFLPDKKKREIGYIPRPFNELFAKLIAQNEEAAGKIYGIHSPDKRPLVIIVGNTPKNFFLKYPHLEYMVDVQQW